MFIVSTLRSYGARKILSHRGYKHLVPTGRRQLVSARRQLVSARRQLVSARRQLVPAQTQFVPAQKLLDFARRQLTACVAMTIVMSFVATLIPVASASLTKSSTMACCVGKTAGHCDSGIPAKKVPPPKSEPMCGLDGAEMEDDGITIVAQPVAEPSHAESQNSHSHSAETNSSQPAAESASLSQPCNMNCASCAAVATRQQKRERNAFQTISYQNASLTTLSFDEDQSLLFSSSRNWEHVIPRGPPLALR